MSVVNDICERFTCISQVTESCPADFRDEYAELGIIIGEEGINGCEDCRLHRGCRSCLWENTDVCSKFE